MANIVFNVAKGRVLEYHERVNNNDPANCALVVIPLLAAGLVSDATLMDYDNVSVLLAGATNENTTMGRKIVTDTGLGPATVDDVNDRAEGALPDISWTAGEMAAAGGAVAKILIAYDPDTTAGDDTTLIPLTAFDITLTPDGNPFTLTGANYFRAS